LIRFSAVPEKPVRSLVLETRSGSFWSGESTDALVRLGDRPDGERKLEGAKSARIAIDREGDHLRKTRVGRLFETRPDIRWILCFIIA
jgi:hypothetical protein